MSIGIRTTLKEIIPEKAWPLLRWFDKYLIYGLYVWFWGKRILLYPRIPIRSDKHVQSIGSFPITVELDVFRPESFSAQLQAEGYCILEGRHSVYLADKNDIEQFCPGLLEKYPSGIGLKIVRSRDVSQDGTPYYTSRQVAPASTWCSMRAVGSMLEKMTVSNLLYLEEVAPRVYDIVRLVTQRGVFYAFVVQHIQGDILTGPPAHDFMLKFKRALVENGMETISISEHRDLQGPEYNRNIVSGKDAVCYVDIQNFVLSDKNRVQRVKDDIVHSHMFTEPYGEILEFLDKENVSFADRKILLFGHHSVGLLPTVLHLQANWCSVLVQDELFCRNLEKYFYLCGLSRFDIFGRGGGAVPGTEDLVVSGYDFICLDESSLSSLNKSIERQSAPDYLLFFCDKGNDWKNVYHVLKDDSFKENYQIKVQGFRNSDVTVTLLTRLSN